MGLCGGQAADLIGCLGEAVHNHAELERTIMRIALVDPSRAIQRAMTELIVPGEHEVLAFSEGQKALNCIGADDCVRALITSV